MIPVHNPQATFPFCPDQTDFLTFRTKDGFGAVMLNLIEGFCPTDTGTSSVQLTTGCWYESMESIPTLVARYTQIKQMRYAPGEGQTPRGAGHPAPIVPSPIPDKLPPVTSTLPGDPATPARRTGWITGAVTAGTKSGD